MRDNLVLGERVVMTHYVDGEPVTVTEPQLELRIDAPNRQGFTYAPIHEDEDTRVWLGTNGTLWHGLVEDFGNQRGYGGAVFKLRTEQGEVEIEGPWSGRPSVYGTLSRRHFVDVLVGKGRTKVAGYMIEVTPGLREWLAEHGLQAVAYPEAYDSQYMRVTLEEKGE